MDYTGAKAYILKRLKEELSPRLSYHGVHHTLDVLNVVEQLCVSENVSPQDTLLLKTAALYHDSGFIINNMNHEELSCTIARKNLRWYGYNLRDIESICGMIMATKIPQNPHNFLEKILCDADLDYLGRDDFYPIGETLYEELKAYNVLHDREAWNRLQVNFLEVHTFFTPTNKKLRENKKIQHLTELKAVVAGY